jgi:hypothetical protein
VKSNLLKGFLANFDLAIMTLSGKDPYLARSSPNKLFDYLSSGIPIIYDPSMIRVLELDMDVQFGIRADMTDFAKLSKMINTLARRRDILRELKLSIKENSKEFHISKWSDELIKNCQKLCL